jgi:hypothetical protein
LQIGKEKNIAKGSSVGKKFSILYDKKRSYGSQWITFAISRFPIIEKIDSASR